MTGVCHLCHELKDVDYCNRCRHWLCAACKKRKMWRAAAAALEIFAGRKEGCCGPVREGS